MIKYDYLVYAVGAETQTFNIPGVKENSCFMKELKDAEKVFPRRSIDTFSLIFLQLRQSVMDCM
jgi:NADH:ubiquinone reductase (non-electrogenic)